MPLREEANEVDLVSLAAVDSLEIVVTVDRVVLIAVGELLLGDSRLLLQTEDGIDVLLLLGIGQRSPSNDNVSIAQSTVTIIRAHHSFLTMGFWHLPSLRPGGGGGGPPGPGCEPLGPPTGCGGGDGWEGPLAGGAGGKPGPAPRGP